MSVGLSLRLLLATLLVVMCGMTDAFASSAAESSNSLWIDAPRRTINNGDIILREFNTPKGIVEVAAEARVRRDVLKLKDIAVFPKGADKLDVGAREVLKIRNGLADEAASQGFRRLRITGERVSGANPGKKINVKVDLDGR